MQLSDVIASPWAIQPEKLEEILRVYRRHSCGESIDDLGKAGIEARLGKPLVNGGQGYTVIDGVAVIPIHGVIAKRMNLFSEISGGASTQLVERDIKAALSDEKVNSILIHIDSPGGTVDGTQNLSDIVRQAREIKPVMTFADGIMASAAYWIGSAADEIVAASDTTQIGSIGVVIAHTDVSKAEEQSGIKTTEISAGKYKRIASQYAPLSEEGAAHIQEKVDQIYTIFVDEVAKNRGVGSDAVLEQMADGKIFLSRDAQQRGMIDHIASMDTTINNMAKGVWPMNKQLQTHAQVEQPASSDVMSVETVKKNYPDIAAALAMEGAVAERERIRECESAGLLGHENIVNAMKFDGKSTAGDVAIAIVNAEREQRADHLQGFRSSAPNPVTFVNVPVNEETSANKDLNRPLEERAKAIWDSDLEVRKEFAEYVFFESAMRAEERGLVKILGGKR